MDIFTLEIKIYESILDITLRSLAVIFMILRLRIFGKNQLSQLNAGDIIYFY